MLDGQGADEILGGYRFFLAARLASLIRQGQWGSAGEFLHHAARWPDVDKKTLIFTASEYLLPAFVQHPFRKLIGKELAPAWLNERWFKLRGVSPHPVRYSAHEREVLNESLCRQLPDLLP